MYGAGLALCGCSCLPWYAGNGHLLEAAGIRGVQELRPDLPSECCKIIDTGNMADPAVIQFLCQPAKHNSGELGVSDSSGADMHCQYERLPVTTKRSYFVRAVLNLFLSQTDNGPNDCHSPLGLPERHPKEYPR